MFQHQGIWLPDGEKHFPLWMSQNGEIVDGKGTYQIKKWRACIPHIKQWRTSVDVGAHVGLWSMQMAKHFRMVHAFEPVMEFRQCWSRNMGYSRTFMCDVEAGETIDPCVTDGAILYGVALGAQPGFVDMVIPSLEEGIDSGGTHVRPFDNNVLRNAWTERHRPSAEMRALDSFRFENVDFVKIDCEGYEHHVIAGARETLLRFKPCVIVEQKQHIMGKNFGIAGTPAVDLLIKMGAKQRAVIAGDHILSWD